MEQQVPQGEGLTLEQYREMKATGMTAEPIAQPDVQDAAVQEQPDAEEVVHTDDDSEAVTEPQDEPEVSDDIEVPEEQKTAFQKALEREKRKAREEAERIAKEQLEQQYDPYKKFFDRLGLDPETAMKQIEETQMRQKAAQLAEQNGWDEQETQWYMEQQKQQTELHDLRVSVAINDLSDNAEYPGIKGMKPQIVQMMKANPSLDVKQAYWAVGGPNLAQQLKREAEQRAIAKRTQERRTVVTDAPAHATTEKPLPAEVLQQARSLGMSETEARRLASADFKNIDEFRAWKKNNQRRA